MAQSDKELEPFNEYGIGIDPGWVNMGCATVKAVSPFKFEILHCGTYNPSQGLVGNIIEFAVTMTARQAIPHEVRHGSQDATLCIERYVSYGNVRSTHSEEILRVIGMLEHAFFIQRGIGPAWLYKAIDWKTKLCQTLVQHTGFDNPSKKGLLDKEFSVAAAKHLTINHELISTDHEADAICLAAYPQVLAQARQEKQRIAAAKIDSN